MSEKAWERRRHSYNRVIVHLHLATVLANPCLHLELCQRTALAPVYIAKSGNSFHDVVNYLPEDVHVCTKASAAIKPQKVR